MTKKQKKTLKRIIIAAVLTAVLALLFHFAELPWFVQLVLCRKSLSNLRRKIMEQNENTLSVLKIAPGQYPQQVEIDNDLKALQQAVGGSIGASYPFADDPVAIVYNDDAKLMGLPLNRALWDEDGLMYDVIAGTFLVVGLGEEDFVSLSPELAQKYEEEFHQPEAFLPLGRRLMVIPVPDESVQNDAEKAVSKPPAEHDR